ncbi:MAG: hypothetical protein WCO23_03950 [bacterium]
MFINKVIAAGPDLSNVSLQRIWQGAGGVCNSEKAKWDLECVMGILYVVFNFFLNIIMFAAFIFILYAAFTYLTAYGDDAKATKGKQYLLWAFIGLFVASASKFLLPFISAWLGAGVTIVSP